MSFVPAVCLIVALVVTLVGAVGVLIDRGAD